MRRLLFGTLIAFGLAFQGSAQEVVVKEKPPHVLVEKRPVRPGPEHVWVAGYHRWDGHAYVWVPGRWDRPPHPHAHWVAHHWVHRHGGWVLVEGHWG
jgi:hypothetical protein